MCIRDSSYSGNPLVNVMSLGLLETNDIVCSGAQNVGSPVLYVGNTTGRDGVGGASFASSELTTTSIDDRPAVQVGDPFIEKFNKWGLYANVIGEVIGTNEVIISHKGKIVAQIPTSALSDETPINIHNIIKEPPIHIFCLLYTSPSPRDRTRSRMPSSA